MSETGFRPCIGTPVKGTSSGYQEILFPLNYTRLHYKNCFEFKQEWMGKIIFKCVFRFKHFII